MPPRADPIVVVDPDPEWATRFEQLAAPLREAVAHLGATVEHVGSTAVPGLAAKPVIDMDVVVGSSEVVGTAIERLGRLGYRHEGDLGIAGREALRWPTGTERHHLYVVIAGSQPHRDHIDFRDALRAEPRLADEYASLKRRLAVEHRDDRAAYVDGKAQFIGAVLNAARANARPRPGLRPRAQAR